MSIVTSPNDANGEYYLKSDVQWAIGSLVIGAVMILAAPITCILSAETWAHADHSSHILKLFAWLARFSVAMTAITLCLGIVFDRRSIRFAIANRRPVGLATAGLYLNVIASWLWVIAAIALLSTTESLLHIFGR